MDETKTNTWDWADAHFVNCLSGMQDVKPWVQSRALHRTRHGCACLSSVLVTQAQEKKFKAVLDQKGRY